MEKKKLFDIEKSVYFRFTSLYCLFFIFLAAFWGLFLLRFHSTPDNQLNDLGFIFVVLLLLTYFFVANIAPAGAIATIVTDLVLGKKVQSVFNVNSNAFIRILQYTLFIFFHAILLAAASVYISTPMLLTHLIPLAIICSLISWAIVYKIHEILTTVKKYTKEAPQMLVPPKQNNRAIIILTAIIINLVFFHLLASFVAYVTEAQNPGIFNDVKVTNKFFAPEQKVIKLMKAPTFEEYAAGVLGMQN